jgi:transposase
MRRGFSSLAGMGRALVSLEGAVAWCRAPALLHLCLERFIARHRDWQQPHACLCGMVQNTLDKSPLSGQVYIFRGRRGDLIKLIWHDGDGMCLLQKRLDRGRFVWPQASNGTVSLTRAQLSMLCEGIDWRQPVRTWQAPMAI